MLRLPRHGGPSLLGYVGRNDVHQWEEDDKGPRVQRGLRAGSKGIMH